MGIILAFLLKLIFFQSITSCQVAGSALTEDSRYFKMVKSYATRIVSSVFLSTVIFTYLLLALESLKRC